MPDRANFRLLPCGEQGARVSGLVPEFKIPVQPLNPLRPEILFASGWVIEE
jgi:hypothetical protein